MGVICILSYLGFLTRDTEESSIKYTKILLQKVATLGPENLQICQLPYLYQVGNILSREYSRAHFQTSPVEWSTMHSHQSTAFAIALPGCLHAPESAARSQ